MNADVTFESLETVVERLLQGLTKRPPAFALAASWESKVTDKERARMTIATSGMTAATPGSGDVAHAAS